MAKWLVTTPNPHYDGITEGVKFENGQAVVEDESTMLVLVNDFRYNSEEIPGENESNGEAKLKRTTKKK